MSTIINEQTLGAINTLVETMADIITPEIVGEENVEKLSGLCEDIVEGLASSSDYTLKAKEITSFDDWEDRVNSEVEFIRNNERKLFPIQSLTAAEYDDITRWKQQNIPPEPPLPGNGKKPIPVVVQKKYDAEMAQYALDADAMADMYVLKVLSIGLVGIDFPGKDDEAKIASMKSKPAGDMAKLYNGIMAISNLTDDSIVPFM